MSTDLRLRLTSHRLAKPPRPITEDDLEEALNRWRSAHQGAHLAYEAWSEFLESEGAEIQAALSGLPDVKHLPRNCGALAVQAKALAQSIGAAMAEDAKMLHEYNVLTARFRLELQGGLVATVDDPK
jgi:hypothetical protein